MRSINKKIQRNTEKTTTIYQQEVNKNPSAAPELRIGDNTFKTNLLEQNGVPPIFNIGDLQPYNAESELGTIRTEEGGNGTNIPSAYDQHTGNNEDLSIEEQHTESRPAQVKEADVQRAEEQLLNTMNIHDPALRKVYIVLYQKIMNSWVFPNADRR